MPKEAVEIPRFEGMVGAVEARDLPPGVAVYAKNLDMSKSYGAFNPLSEDTAKTGVAVKGTHFTVFDSGQKAAYYDNVDGKVKVVEGLQSSTPSIVTATSTTAAAKGSGNRTGVSDGESVRIGLGSAETALPKWVGNVYHLQFSAGSVPSDPSVFDAQLITEGVKLGPTLVKNLPTTTDGVSNNEEVFFIRGRKYKYYASLVYDGIQESPLRPIGQIIVSNTSTDFRVTQPDADGYASVELAVRCYLVESVAFEETLPRRVTGVNIYRSESSVSTDDDIIEGTASLIRQIDINDAGWSTFTEGDGSGYEWDLVDGGETYNTYEERTGVNQTLEHMQLHYGLSTSADSFHIVGDVWHPSLKDINTWLFRSKAYRFDMFDWAADYLVLPGVPTALAYYNGRVFAFADGRTFIVNPASFDVEDTWEGIGCDSNRSFVSTDRGLFWADSSNIYHWDGATVRRIGDAVLTNEFLPAAGWLARDQSEPAILFYEPVLDCLVVIYKNSTFQGLMYHMGTGRWCHLTFTMPGTATDILGVVQRPDGTSLLSTDDIMLHMFADASNRSWQWVGHQIPGLGSRYCYYNAYVGTINGFPTSSGLTYYEDEPNYTSGTAWSNVFSIEDSEEDPVIIKGVINSSPWKKVRSFSFALSGTGSQDVQHVTLIRRGISPR